jgi:hypothetical protein
LIQQDRQDCGEQVEGANLIDFDRTAGCREVKIVGAHRDPERGEPDHDVDPTPGRNDGVTGCREGACIRYIEWQDQSIDRALIWAAPDLVEDVVQGLFAAS